MNKKEKFIVKNINLKVPMKYQVNEVKQNHYKIYAIPICIILIALLIFPLYWKSSQYLQNNLNIIWNDSENNYSYNQYMQNRLDSIYMLEKQGYDVTVRLPFGNLYIILQTCTAGIDCYTTVDYAYNIYIYKWKDFTLIVSKEPFFKDPTLQPSIIENQEVWLEDTGDHVVAKYEYQDNYYIMICNHDAKENLVKWLKRTLGENKI